MQAELLATGADTHKAANLRAAYRSAADFGDPEIFEGAERELRKWIAKAQMRKVRCGIFCKPDCHDPSCPLRLGC